MIIQMKVDIRKKKSVISNTSASSVSIVLYEEFEDRGDQNLYIYRRRTDNTMVKMKSTKGHATFYKTYA
jgi:hypothetical protein